MSAGTEVAMYICAVIGTLFSIQLQISPWTIVRTVSRTGTTAGFSSVPFCIFHINSLLWTIYGGLRRDMFIWGVNSFGFVLSIYFAANFYAYMPKKFVMNVILGAGYALLYVMCPLMLVVVSDSDLQINVFGWTCIAVFMFAMASPLVKMAQVIRLHDVRYLSFPMAISIFISGLAWAAYGLLASDFFLMLNNCGAAFLGLVQLVLFAKYGGWSYFNPAHLARMIVGALGAACLFLGGKAHKEGEDNYDDVGSRPKAGSAGSIPAAVFVAGGGIGKASTETDGPYDDTRNMPESEDIAVAVRDGTAGDVLRVITSNPQVAVGEPHGQGSDQHVTQSTLDEDVEVGILSRDQSSMLETAVQQADVNKISVLVDTGISSVTERDAAGDTALHLAAQLEDDTQAPVVEFLANAGADVNAMNAEGFTPLDVAIQHDNAEVTHALLKAGAEPNPVDPKVPRNSVVPEDEEDGLPHLTTWNVSDENDSDDDDDDDDDGYIEEEQDDGGAVRGE